MSTENFKGPIAYYIPETWSKIGRLFEQPFLRGRGLDARPGVMGGGAMEINTVPRLEASASNGIHYTHIPRLSFPTDDEGRAVLVQDVTYYSKAALYDGFLGWRRGGEHCSGTFRSEGAHVAKLSTRPTHYDQSGKTIEGVNEIFDTKVFADNTWGLVWNKSKVAKPGQFPEYFRVEEDHCVALAAKDVPKSTGLHEQKFKLASAGAPFTSPDQKVKGSAWTDPGPVSPALKVRLGDGSLVTYRWYRFVDQPSFQQYLLPPCSWSEQKREALQSFIEKLHQQWPTDRDYMAPPTSGKLVRFDPALFVKPPKGKEVGYVPIVIRQEAAR